MSKPYTITVRGQIPHDLGRKIAEAHSVAIQNSSVTHLDVPADKASEPDVVGQLPVE